MKTFSPSSTPEIIRQERKCPTAVVNIFLSVSFRFFCHKSSAILSVSDPSLFGNCLADLSVSELLTLKHSLQHLKATDGFEKDHLLNSVDMKSSEVPEENCEKPATMALVAEER